MSNLYIDRKDIEIRTDGGRLLFYDSSGHKGSVPIAHLERLVIRGNAKISTSVIGLLGEAGVGILILSGRNNNQLATFVGRPHNDVRRRMGQIDAYRDPGFRATWSSKIVIAKTCAQIRLLERGMKCRHDKRSMLFRGHKRLQEILRNLECSSESYTVESLRGIEGAAAKFYFESLRSLFPSSLQFTDRNRRPPRDPVNACLSLGYTLLHFEAVSACHSSGVDPYLGLYHEPTFGRESLASDLIEPLRPHIDEWVWDLFRKRILNVNHFSYDKNRSVMGKTGRKHYYEHFQPLSKAVRRILRRQAAAAANQFGEFRSPIVR